MRRSAPRRRGKVKAIAVALALSTAGVLAAATPAQAAGNSVMNISGCSFSPPDYGCSTATMYANPNHWMKITAFPPYLGTVTCYLHDSGNGNIVGQVSRSWYHFSGTTVTVNGLYGSYFGSCVNSKQYGSGQISN